MSMNTSQAAIWKQVAQVYEQWDQGGRHPMPFSELMDKLPAVAPDLVKDAIMQAAGDRQAEITNEGEEGGFKPRKT